MSDIEPFAPVLITLGVFIIAIIALYQIWKWVFSARIDDDSYESYTERYYDDALNNTDKNRKSYDISDYGAKDSLLSPAEINFYHVLKQVVGTNVLISPKVNLWDIFYLKRSKGKEFMALKSKIDRKHVDFLLCHAQTLKPIMGIELDDKSHQQTARQERDQFVDSVFKASGLPIVHIPAQRSYNTEQIENLVKLPLINEKEAPQSEVISSTSQIICPKCGGEMVLRTVKSGTNKGRKFWGCTNYPNCRQMLAHKE
jgi:very-short-patch-repair endonuclease/predicted RNA-binding Zn-ribbon protein involved in translation (DUF1610 family)